MSLVTFARDAGCCGRASISRPPRPAFQFVERHAWIPSFGIDYYVGIDGLSLMLLVLTGFLTPIALLSGWHGIEKHVKEFSILMLLLEASMIGVFCALDVFLFYIFWDFVLIPMYFMIGIWGYDQRIYAAVKFILYTMAGSVLMLIAIIGLSWMHQTMTGEYSFDLLKLYELQIPADTQYWFFLAFTHRLHHQGAAVPVPHLAARCARPGAHAAGSVILAGVMLKMGGYGLIRFAYPLFPDAALMFSPVLATLAVIAIVYGALVAMVQPDMKKLVAYSSVSHMGFVVLGITAMNTQGVHGASYQMLAHGVSTGAPVLPGRHAVGSAAYAPDQRVRRAQDGDAAVHGGGLDHHAVVDRPARHERLHRRVPDHARRLPVGRALRGDRRARRDSLRGLHAVDVPARVLRHRDQRSQQAVAGPVVA